MSGRGWRIALTPALSPRERIPPNHISCFWPLNPNRHNLLLINVVVVGFMGRGNRFARPDLTRGLLAASPCREHSPTRSHANPMLPHSGSRSRRLSLSRAGEGWGEGGRSSHTQHKTRVNFCGQNRDQFNSLAGGPPHVPSCSRVRPPRRVVTRASPARGTFPDRAADPSRGRSRAETSRPGT